MATVMQTDLTDTSLFADGFPHRLFDDIRAAPAIYRQNNPSGGTIWHLTKYEDVRSASKNTDIFSSRLIVYTTIPNELIAQTRHNMMFNDPPQHSRLRGFAAKAFSPGVVARFEGWIRELCVDIADRVSAMPGEFDAVRHITAYLPAQVINAILGVPADHRERVLDLVMRQVGDADPDIGPAEALKATAQLQDYSLELRALKFREPGVDMATQLAERDAGDELSDREYGTMVQTLASAGFETTHTTLAHSLWMSALDPQIRAALDTTDRKRLTPAIEEILRLVTPVMYFGRIVTQDYRFRDAQMAKGDFVMMWFAAANRDPLKYKHPHEFIIDRPGRNQLSFGAGGPHFCIGSYLAKLEIELLYQEFSRRGLRLELAGEPLRLHGNFINGVRKLPMRVVR